MPFNPPPGWPTPPSPDWVPNDGWSPGSHWPSAPYGWDFGVPWTPPPGAVEAERPRRFGRRAASVFVNHPMWTSSGAILGIVGVVISVVQIVQAMGPDPEDLEVALSDFGGAQMVAAQASGAVAEGGAGASVSAIPINLTLKNNGGEPSLITEIVAKVERFEVLDNCTGAPAGASEVRGRYTFAIPAEAALDDHRRPVRFEVRPGAVDRMDLTVGPEVEDLSDGPTVIGLSLTLIHDDGKELDAGSFAVVRARGAADAATTTATTDNDCVQKNLDTLESVYSYQSLKSPELDALRANYRALSGG